MERLIGCTRVTATNSIQMNLFLSGYSPEAHQEKSVLSPWAASRLRAHGPLFPWRLWDTMTLEQLHVVGHSVYSWGAHSRWKWRMKDGQPIFDSTVGWHVFLLLRLYLPKDTCNRRQHLSSHGILDPPPVTKTERRMDSRKKGVSIRLQVVSHHSLPIGRVCEVLWTDLSHTRSRRQWVMRGRE